MRLHFASSLEWTIIIKFQVFTVSSSFNGPPMVANAECNNRKLNVNQRANDPNFLPPRERANLDKVLNFMFQFLKLLLHMPSHDRKKCIITFLRLHSTTAKLQSGPDGSLFPPLQMLCSLSTEEPLIRARNRVLSDLHDCLNPPNNNRNNYYPQKIKQP